MGRASTTRWEKLSFLMDIRPCLSRCRTLASWPPWQYEQSSPLLHAPCAKKMHGRTQRVGCPALPGFVAVFVVLPSILPRRIACATCSLLERAFPAATAVTTACSAAATALFTMASLGIFLRDDRRRSPLSESGSVGASVASARSTWRSAVTCVLQSASPNACEVASPTSPGMAAIFVITSWLRWSALVGSVPCCGMLRMSSVTVCTACAVAWLRSFVTMSGMATSCVIAECDPASSLEERLMMSQHSSETRVCTSLTTFNVCFSNVSSRRSGRASMTDTVLLSGPWSSSVGPRRTGRGTPCGISDPMGGLPLLCSPRGEPPLVQMLATWALDAVVDRSLGAGQLEIMLPVSLHESLPIRVEWLLPKAKGLRHWSLRLRTTEDGECFASALENSVAHLEARVATYSRCSPNSSSATSALPRHGAL
mmetsp:Transcript_74328/g.168372  ORF Transcript_74328/g.168372 Transcript_74328/m.168372 type:complete len:425 (+) Transcript_74328:307-1581(+)